LYNQGQIVALIAQEDFTQRDLGYLFLKIEQELFNTVLLNQKELVWLQKHPAFINTVPVY
jgi:hypothetical protein